MSQPQATKAPAPPAPKRADNVGDADRVAERNSTNAQREARRLNGLKQILDNKDARAYLWDLLEFCGVGRTSFTGNSTTFFNEGQRNVGLRIQADLTKHYPDSYLTMLKEEGNA